MKTRVVQRQIDYQYLPVSPSLLQVGSKIDFDCYIKRFNGYVIIIEAGSQISEELYAKVRSHARIYIEHSQRDRFERYCDAHTKEEIVAEAHSFEEKSECKVAVEALTSKIAKSDSVDERICLLYGSGQVLMNRCFKLPEGEQLPITELTQYAKILSEFIVRQRYRFQQFLTRMPAVYTEPNHALNVSILATILAKALNMTNRQLDDVALSGLLHDIGKRRVDADILGKPAQLDSDEFEKVREHVVFSVQDVKENRINNPQILSAIRYHHEKLDGSGYPNGLVGNQIPVMAQILGVCDVFDALTTDRTYRVQYSSFEALKLMKKEMNREINSVYVDHLIILLSK